MPWSSLFRTSSGEYDVSSTLPVRKSDALQGAAVRARGGGWRSLLHTRRARAPTHTSLQSHTPSSAFRPPLGPLLHSHFLQRLLPLVQRHALHAAGQVTAQHSGSRACDAACRASQHAPCSRSHLVSSACQGHSSPSRQHRRQATGQMPPGGKRMPPPPPPHPTPRLEPATTHLHGRMTLVRKRAQTWSTSCSLARHPSRICTLGRSRRNSRHLPLLTTAPNKLHHTRHACHGAAGQERAPGCSVARELCALAVRAAAAPPSAPWHTRP
jgi:hypothetical protein